MNKSKKDKMDELLESVSQKEALLKPLPEKRIYSHANDLVVSDSEESSVESLGHLVRHLSLLIEKSHLDDLYQKQKWSLGNMLRWFGEYFIKGLGFTGAILFVCVVLGIGNFILNHSWSLSRYLHFLKSFL